MRAVVHAHFYQPPRENPWTGRIPRQDSAHPAHDWNERITDECYRPNARSRLLGADNRIDEIVNNYAFMSFDFGPTLLTWLEHRAPRVYEQIIEGDRISQRLHDGHGNAIAHVYNHVIMPLANFRDKRTQIVWGLRDFEWRFGRKSESIWLAETAINLQTVRMLIEFGIRYVVLSPYQALRTRPLDRSRGWTDASGGKVDPRQPYRCFLKDARRRRVEDRFLDVFFYDGPLAADVSFAHLLRSAPAYAERIQQAGADLNGGPGLVSVATDGEVYGHHEPFGDMCLAYLARREAPRRGIELTNYGRYLDLHPPTQEVDLNFGDQDEGTAWSCAHGVGRWERDCGCSTGGREGWNQRWRTPLRRGFDAVRDRLAETFLEKVSPLVHDPWAVRDDYVLALLDPKPEARRALLEQHAQRELSGRERQCLWSLLESQRFAMYMYTSCAWFFADISGIETVQNMAYARRAIELARPWLRLDLEEMLLDYLADGRSNIPAMGHGADVYRRFVLPQRVLPESVAGGVSICAGVLGGRPPEREFRYRIHTESFAGTHGDLATAEVGADDDGPASVHAVLRLTHRDTEEEHFFETHLYRSAPGDLRCYVLPIAGEQGQPIEPRFPGTPDEAQVRAAGGGAPMTLSNLVAENRTQIIETAYEKILLAAEALLERLFEQGRDLIATCREANVETPPVLRAAAGHVLTRRLSDKAFALEQSLRERLGSGPQRSEDAHVLVAEEQARKLSEIADLLNFARSNELPVSIDALVAAYGRVIQELLEKLQESPDCLWAQQCEEVIRSSYDLHFPLDRRPLEDLGYRVLWKHRDRLRSWAHSSSETDARCWQAFEALAVALQLNIHWIIEQENGSSSSR